MAQTRRRVTARLLRGFGIRRIETPRPVARSLLDLRGGDCSRPVDDHGSLSGVENSGFHAVTGTSSVDKSINTAIKIVEHVLG